MIVVTGAAGFIGSCLISRLNENNFNYIIAVDDFSNPEKNKNLEGKKIQKKIDREEFFHWLDNNQEFVEFIFHIGARTDTSELNKEIFNELNVNYSKAIWKACCNYQIPLVYASCLLQSPTIKLPYEESKNEFDVWAIEQEEKPFFWAGLKLYEVYGPNEYHKEKMASSVFQAYDEIIKTGEVKLSSSSYSKINDSEQTRNMVYVKDVVEVIIYLMHYRKNSGIYNVGSGKEISLADLIKYTCKAMGKEEEDICFVDAPQGIREKPPYFIKASRDKLDSIGYHKPFTSLEDGILDYVRNYLMEEKYY